MAIEENQVRIIAQVDVTDEYRVELRQIKKRTDYSPEEAVQLAEELVEAATEAQRALNEATALSSLNPLSKLHLYFADKVAVPVLAAIHPECKTGKCGNCDGQVLNNADEWVPCYHECHQEAAT